MFERTPHGLAAEIIGMLAWRARNPAAGTFQPTTDRGHRKLVEGAEAFIAQPDFRGALDRYLANLADLRSRAADPQRDAYTAAIGQLYRFGLITEDQRREALDRERVGR